MKGHVVDRVPIRSDSGGDGSDAASGPCRFNNSNNSTLSYVVVSYVITSLFAGVLKMGLARCMSVLGGSDDDGGDALPATIDTAVVTAADIVVLTGDARAAASDRRGIDGAGLSINVYVAFASAIDRCDPTPIAGHRRRLLVRPPLLLRRL